MEYYNLLKNLDLVLSIDKKYDKKTIVDFIMKNFNSDDFKIIESTNLPSSLVNFVFCYKNKNYSCTALVKNITGAGWSNKPKYRRVQVANIKNEAPDVISNSDEKMNLILGYYNYDDNPIFACWDPYRYLEHNTVRSCYISVDTLKRGYEKGYHYGVDSGQVVWVFTPDNIDKFFEDYLDYLHN